MSDIKICVQHHRNIINDLEEGAPSHGLGVHVDADDFDKHLKRVHDLMLNCAIAHGVWLDASLSNVKTRNGIRAIATPLGRIIEKDKETDGVESIAREVVGFIKKDIYGLEN